MRNPSGIARKSDLIGLPIEDLETPALLLEAEVADRNIRRMAEFFRGRLCRLRPHFSAHKCPELARRQLAAGGAIGIGCGGLDEAQLLARCGFANVLVAASLFGGRKVVRAAELAKLVHLRVVVDDPGQAKAFSEAAAKAKATIGVMIGLDVGMGQGVCTEQAALDLARHIDGLSGIRLDGLLAQDGHAVYVNDFERRAVQSRQAAQQALETRQRIEDDGIPLGILTSGSSATYQVLAPMEGIDEIQAGSYPTMDWRYSELSPEFNVALSVLARVVGRRPDGAILDVGCMGIGSEFGPPRVRDHVQAEVAPVLAEGHCVVRRPPNWRVGEAVQLIVSHASTTCNLYRRMYVHHEGRVLDVWPIGADALHST